MSCIFLMHKRSEAPSAWTTHLRKFTFFREKAEKNISLQLHLAQPPYPGSEVSKFKADLRKPASSMWKIVGQLQFSAKWKQIRKGVPKAAGKGDGKIKEVFQEKMENVLGR